MLKFIPTYRPVHTGVSIVGKEAYKDYRLWSKVRDPKKFDYYTDYRRITRKIWKKIAEDSLNYDSVVYDKDFFYLIPQVISNKPFIELPNGKIKSNDLTKGDIYTPIFCNLFKNIKHFCWSLDGTYTDTYIEKLQNTINKFVPKYYFILPTLRKNKL
jgi:DNA-binding ferritin-like protein (Dps family)